MSVLVLFLRLMLKNEIGVKKNAVSMNEYAVFTELQVMLINGNVFK